MKVWYQINLNVILPQNTVICLKKTSGIAYFIQLSKSLKKQYTTFTKRMKTSEKAQEASYLVAQIIAKNKDPHTTAETTVLQSCCAIVRTMFGPELEKEVKKIPLADSTIGRRIQHMSEDNNNNE